MKEEVLKTIHELRKDKRSIREIARIVGLSKTQVQRILVKPRLAQARQDSNKLLSQLTLDIATNPYKILLSVENNTARKNFLDTLLKNVPFALVSDGYQNDTLTLDRVLKSVAAISGRINVPLIITTPLDIDAIDDDLLEQFDVLLQGHRKYDLLNRQFVQYVTEITE